MDNLVEAWLAAVRQKNLDALTELYAPGAVLIPTMSPRVCTTAAERRAYFSSFLETCEGAPQVLWHSRIGEDVHVGLYRFGSLVARFTFVVRGGRIQHHHSSKLPQ